jgi:hypothetical protein
MEIMRSSTCRNYGSALGGLWRTLSDSERKIYEKMASDDKIRYLLEKEGSVHLMAATGFFLSNRDLA